MADPYDTAEPDAQTLAELSALADGTLDPDCADSVRERIARSPELSRRYERERRAVGALRAVRSDRAPARLRIAVATRRQPVARPRVRVIYGGALAAAIAAVVAALVLLLPGGTPGAPSVSQAATLALRGPVMAAPPSLAASKLGQDVQEVYFPNWSRGLDWRAVGQRIDRIGHRLAVTVFYQRSGRQIAYTILAAPALPWPGTGMRRVAGVELQSLASGARLIVTWRRAGHTCILSGSGVSLAELSELAAWRVTA